MCTHTHIDTQTNKKDDTSIKESSLKLWKEMENTGTGLVMVLNLKTRAVRVLLVHIIS